MTRWSIAFRNFTIDPILDSLKLKRTFAISMNLLSAKNLSFFNNGTFERLQAKTGTKREKELIHIWYIIKTSNERVLGYPED